MKLGPPPRPLADRFWEKVDKRGADECWPWQAGFGTGGYGLFGVGSRSDGTTRMKSAHRVAYELSVGPIPEGLQIDHLFRNLACVNPAHMEPVTLR